jgi:hypothetical protein
MATIRKRGKKWQAQVRRAGQRSASRSFNFKSDAETWAREMDGRADRGELRVDHSEFEHLTIKDVLLRYRDSVVPLKRGAEVETYIIGAILRQPFVSMSLVNLSSAPFTSYRDQRLKTVQGVQNLKTL